ncbi:UNVERIFIED_CONTAM: Replication protein A DNA-binding subunit B [Sesamum angustifolium]|uniref:Replication protein A DNA-binding subunit B n=1 Tax=Sesamum angustifolium TaxID=2727405 RepID=A0AAW2KWH6_9LAMI
MAKAVSPDAISFILTNPCPDSSSDLPEIIVQVLDLKPTGNKYMFMASDGKMKVRALLQSALSSEVTSGNIQNLGLIRVLDYTLNDIPTKNEKFLIVSKCEAVSPALEAEHKAEVKTEGSGIVLKPKQEMDVESEVKSEAKGIVLKPKEEVVAKSAAQIVHEQHGKNILTGDSMAPAARMAMTRRIHPLVSLNPYQGIWTIKVRVTSKGSMRTYKNARGEGYGEGLLHIKGDSESSKQAIQDSTNDYEMTLNENSEVEEARNEATFIPETKFNFVPIDELGPYVNGRELVDVIGVLQSVSPTMSIRRKSNNETIPKRDITIADETKKTVVVSLWNDLATSKDKNCLIWLINLLYDSEGKDTALAAIGSGLSPSTQSGTRSMYSDRVSLAHITSNPSLGEDKPVFFCIKAYISYIKPDQAMWYRACKTCNKKVTEAVGSGYWCEGCQKNEDNCSLRYIMAVKVSDASGEAYLSDGDSAYQAKLKEATWVPHLFRVSVTPHEYNNEKKQRITIRAISPLIMQLNPSI